MCKPNKTKLNVTFLKLQDALKIIIQISFKSGKSTLQRGTPYVWILVVLKQISSKKSIILFK